MAELPTGTVTFLFTDIEGSTRLVADLGDAWPPVLEQHNRILREAIRGAGGIDLRTEGDAFFAVFRSAPASVAAAAAAQRALAEHDWPADAPIQAARELLEDYRDGVYLAELAPITDPHLVVAAFADAVGARAEGQRALLDTLREHVRDREMLLVADNFERVLEAAPVVAALLDVGPRLRVLATSREPLHIHGEQELACSPWRFPAPAPRRRSWSAPRPWPCSFSGPPRWTPRS